MRAKAERIEHVLFGAARISAFAASGIIVPPFSKRRIRRPTVSDVSALLVPASSAAAASAATFTGSGVRAFAHCTKRALSLPFALGWGHGQRRKA